MNAAAQFINTTTLDSNGNPKPYLGVSRRVAELVGLDVAWGLGYDIDARNGVNPEDALQPLLGDPSKRNPPLKFEGLAVKTRTYTASDLKAEFKIAGDGNLAATAQRSYLVQYARTDGALDLPAAIAGYHNAVIGVYADLVRKGIEDPDIYWDLTTTDSFNNYGLPRSEPCLVAGCGDFVHDGVIVAAEPWVGAVGNFRVPIAIGWADGYRGIGIWGSPKKDVMFYDRFDSDSVSSIGTALIGGEGDDVLVGGSQTDKLGFDTLYGGEGSDTFVFGYSRYGIAGYTPYRDVTGASGTGLNNYAVIVDFDPREDKLILPAFKEEISVKKSDDIDRSLKGRWADYNPEKRDGVGLAYSNGDVFAYIPDLSYGDALAFLNSSKTTYKAYDYYDLDYWLFQDRR